MATIDQKRAAWARLLWALLLGLSILCGAILLMFLAVRTGDWLPEWLPLLLVLAALAVIIQGAFLYPLFNPARELCRIYLEPYPRFRTGFLWLATLGLIVVLVFAVYAAFATDWLLR